MVDLLIVTGKGEGMQKPAKSYYTPEEYLALEEEAEYKSEYYNGEIFAMAGASVNHNRLSGNLYVRLNQSFAGGDCEAFVGDVRVWVVEKKLFTYPDVIVIRGEPHFYEGRTDTVTNPLILIEVLSESTKNYDRGEKFEFYRTLETLKEYVLVDQYKYHIEQFFVGGEGKWVLSEYGRETDVLKFSFIDLEIPLTAIYQRVKFDEA